MAVDQPQFLEEVPTQLRESIEDICSSVPGALDIFQQLFEYAKDYSDLRKKNKTSPQPSEISENNMIFQLKDVSVLTPLRKKLNLVLSLSPDTKKPMLSLLKDNIPQFVISELNKNVKFATFLPVPEKKNLSYLFIYYAQSSNPDVTEPVLITLNKDAIIKQFIKLNLLPKDASDFALCVDYLRKQAILIGFRIADPFSVASQASPSFHVECHRGTKEGTLYFLPDHILFGFKKPILFFESQDIESITYSSITRLTFNVTLITKEAEKYEFSMIDQNEFTKIDEYVKRKQVIDKSMSDELKAKPTSKSQQQMGEHTSALEEAALQMKDEPRASDIPMESDDEDADQNFEGESDLSDGSGSDSEDNLESENRAVELETAKEEEQEEMHEVQDEIQDEEDDEEEEQQSEDIPLEYDYDDGDDDEGSGVEYD